MLPPNLNAPKKVDFTCTNSATLSMSAFAPTIPTIMLLAIPVAVYARLLLSSILDIYISIQ